MKNNLLRLFLCLLFVGSTTFVNAQMLSMAYLNNSGQNKESKTLKDVLSVLESKYKVSFMYRNHLATVKISQPKEKVKFTKVENELNFWLTPKGLAYKKVREDFYVVLEPKKSEMGRIDPIKPTSDSSNELNDQVLMERLSYQTGNVALYNNFKSVSGEVVDTDGSSVPGVNVIVKGSTRGTVTDLNGKYALDAEDTDVLVFSFIGYQTEEVVVGSQSVIDVTLISDITQLSEVIVTAYNEQTKESITGSAVSVDTEILQNAPRPSFQESLQGNVAGVQAQTGSGQPGAAPTVRIRGVGSISAGSSPLYVIDGIPVVSGDVSRLANSANTLAGLNPNDIESATVLKDASATSLYGSQAANGVIIIKTKSGKAGKTKFNFTAQTGQSEITMSEKNRPLNTSELSELLIEGRMNAYGETQDEAQTYIYDRIDEDISTDWFNELTRKGTYSMYSLNAAGGNEKTNFFSSLAYYKQEAVIIGVDYEKINAKLNLKHQANDKLNFTSGITFSNQKLHTISDGGSYNNPVRAMYRTAPWFSVKNDDGTYNTDFNSTYNHVGLAERNKRESKIYNILGNIGASYNFTEDLSFDTKVSIDFVFADEFRYDNPDFGAGRNDGGVGYAYTTKYVNTQITNILRYKKQLTDAHGFGIFIGQEARQQDYNSVSAQASNFSDPSLFTLSNASVFDNAASFVSGYRIASYFTNLEYNFREKIFVQGSYRRDGSSRFGKNVRWGNFWSAGASWNLHKEDFLSGAEFISELKIRTSIGENGNQSGIDDHASKGYFATGADYNGNPGYSMSNIENGNLTWEKNSMFNIGVDFSLFNRLTGSVDYYNRSSSALLYTAPVSSTNGLDELYQNTMAMSNKGIELSLNSVNIQKADFTWETSFNFSTLKNEITDVVGTEGRIISGTTIYEEGKPFNSYYMPGYAGVNADTGDAEWWLDESKTEKTNVYGDAQPFNQGTSLPKWFGGLTNNLSYKGIEFSFQFNFNWGTQLYNTWDRYMMTDGSRRLSSTGNMSRQIFERRWQKPGDQTDVPRVVYGNKQSGSSSMTSTRFLYDGSYIRLRDITLAYNLPSAWVSKIKLSNVRVYARGSNLWTYVKSETLDRDPETFLSGRLDQQIPISKQVLFGLDISF